MDIKKQLAISVRGASHIRDEKPLQDYSLAIKGDDFSIAVVCDGHGGDKHFRSEKGSEIAAEVTKNKLIEFFEHNKTWEQFINNTDKKLSHLKASILAVWQLGIEDYTKQNPFTKEELKKASASFPYVEKYDVSEAYGTTALATLICNEYYLVLMIGDGAIAKIKSDYSTSIVTFAGKPEYEDQRSDSFCDNDSYQKIYFSYDRVVDEAYAFGLCTDGISKAFISDDILLDKINNYLNYYAEKGLEEATRAISEQLNELTRVSWNRDDISIAFATMQLEKFDKSKQPQAEETAEETQDGQAPSGEAIDNEPCDGPDKDEVTSEGEDCEASNPVESVVKGTPEGDVSSV